MGVAPLRQYATIPESDTNQLACNSRASLLLHWAGRLTCSLITPLNPASTPWCWNTLREFDTTSSFAKALQCSELDLYINSHNGNPVNAVTNCSNFSSQRNVQNTTHYSPTAIPTQIWWITTNTPSKHCFICPGPRLGTIFLHRPSTIQQCKSVQLLSNSFGQHSATSLPGGTSLMHASSTRADCSPILGSSTTASCPPPIANGCIAQLTPVRPRLYHVILGQPICSRSSVPCPH